MNILAASRRWRQHWASAKSLIPTQLEGWRSFRKNAEHASRTVGSWSRHAAVITASTLSSWRSILPLIEGEVNCKERNKTIYANCTVLKMAVDKTFTTQLSHINSDTLIANTMLSLKQRKVVFNPLMEKRLGSICCTRVSFYFKQCGFIERFWTSIK